MKRLAATALALLAVSCAARTQVTEIPANELPRSIYSTVLRTGDAVERSVVIYFVRRVEGASYVLEPVSRSGRTPLTAADFAMSALLKANLATEEERELKLGTAIPSETKLLGIEIDDRIAEVNLSSAFEAPEDELTHLLRVAQVVWTLTELHDVDAVRFSIHGVPQPVIAQDGRAHQQVGRGRYSRFAPTKTDPLPVGSEPLDPQIPGAVP